MKKKNELSLSQYTMVHNDYNHQRYNKLDITILYKGNMGYLGPSFKGQQKLFLSKFLSLIKF